MRIQQPWYVGIVILSIMVYCGVVRHNTTIHAVVSCLDGCMYPSWADLLCISLSLTTPHHTALHYTTLHYRTRFSDQYQSRWVYVYVPTVTTHQVSLMLRITILTYQGCCIRIPSTTNLINWFTTYKSVTDYTTLHYTTLHYTTLHFTTRCSDQS